MKNIPQQCADSTPPDPKDLAQIRAFRAAFQKGDKLAVDRLCGALGQALAHGEACQHTLLALVGEIRRTAGTDYALALTQNVLLAVANAADPETRDNTINDLGKVAAACGWREAYRIIEPNLPNPFPLTFPEAWGVRAKNPAFEDVYFSPEDFNRAFVDLLTAAEENRDLGECLEYCAGHGLVPAASVLAAIVGSQK